MSEKKSGLKKAFTEFIWPRRKIVFIGLILILISRAASLILPWQSKILIDDVVPQSDFVGLRNLLIVVGVAILLQPITSFLLTRILSVEAQHLISLLRAKVQKHVISLPINYFDNTKSGELVSRIMTDVEGVRNLIGTGLVQLVGGSITAIASVFILISINAKMV